MDKKLLIIKVDYDAGESSARRLKEVLLGMSSLKNYEIIVTPIIEGIITNDNGLIVMSFLDDKEVRDLIHNDNEPR